MAIIIDMNGNCTQDTDAEFRALVGTAYSEEILSAGWTEVPRPEMQALAVAASVEAAAEPPVEAPPGFDADGFLARVYASQE